MEKLLTVILITLSNGLFAQNDSANLIVNVDGIKQQEGKIFIALFDNEDNFLGKEREGASMQVDGTSLTFTFEGLKEGPYAISIFHDVNDNGKLDANFMGIPNEPYAFSNNAKGMFGPPKFEDCRFDLVDSIKIISISL